MNTYQTRAKTALQQQQKGDENATRRVKAVRGTSRPALGEVTNKTHGKAKVAKVGSAAKKRSSSTNAAVERAKVSAAVKDLKKKVATNQNNVVVAEKKAPQATGKKTLKAELSEEEKTLAAVAVPAKKEAAKEAKDKEEEYTWDDLDADDSHDPVMVSEYVVEIFKYLYLLEKETMPNPSYMSEQTEITWKMRTILVDWLIEVHNKFRMLPETLFLAINIIDRFLSHRIVSLCKLQLVGMTALFVASKYEEVTHPCIKNFLYMADNGYTEDEVLCAERYILQVLNFSLQYPNPLNFLRRISKAEDYDIQTRTLGKYLMEISLLDHKFLELKPSLVSAAAVYFARKMLFRKPTWNNNLRYYSGGYKAEELVPVVSMMVDFLLKQDTESACYKKYASKKFMKVSIFVSEWIGTHHNSAKDSFDDDHLSLEDASENY